MPDLRASGDVSKVALLRKPAKYRDIGERQRPDHTYGDVSGKKQLAERLKVGFGNLDVLFVNAGVTEMKPVDQWDEAAYNRSFDTNMRGPFFLIYSRSFT
jgi:NAD(P)-dependent dehydrogenase (short-subunit alcohol dehydrogenase family)